jgi:hypothetical protein
MSDINEVMEFLRDNVPTKEEMTEQITGLHGELTGLREEMNQRFDDLEAKLDVREQLRLLDRRIAKLEDEKHSGEFSMQHT